MTNFWLTNVRIETGYEQPENAVASTKTELVSVRIEGEQIVEITKQGPPVGSDVVDAQGALIIPAFREMHIHIDKTYYGGPWKAVKPAVNGIFTRLEEERVILKEQLETAEERAKKMLELLISQGHTHIRTHCNVDPNVGIQNLQATVRALEAYKDYITYEIVAFPQPGLLRSNSVVLVREAMANGATHVGGVDPATVDRHIENSLDTIFAIAKEFDAAIDIHLHDPDSLGAFQMEQIAERTHAFEKHGKVTISHALALGDLVEPRLQAVTAQLAEAGIDVTTTIPVNRPTIPVSYLWQHGVPVSVGHDSITDHWSPFGTGDTIQKLALIGERFRVSDEIGLSQLLRFATGGVTPLSAEGEVQWPKVGDQASFLLVEASCSAEAIARQKPIQAVYGKGKRFEAGQVVEAEVRS